MIDISKELQDALYSNFIPRCEVSISIKKAYYTYPNTFREEEVLRFESYDISDLSIKSKTDIFGRELPSISLSWKQAATFDNRGIVSENYKNVVERKHAVDVSFSFFLSNSENSWQYVKDTYTSWQDLLDKKESWQDVLSNEKKEEVQLRRLFLKNPPNFSDDSWVWEAADALYFCEKETDTFAGFSSPIKSFNTRTSIGQRILSDEDGDTSKNAIFSKALLNSTDLTTNSTPEWNVIGKPLVVSGSTKNILKDMFSTVNRYLDFKEKDGSIGLKQVSITIDEQPIRQIKLENMKSFPVKEETPSIANYVFDFSEPSVDRDNFYNISSTGVQSNDFFEGIEKTYRYNFEDVGTPYNENGEIELTPEQLTSTEVRVSEKQTTVWVASPFGSVISLKVFPIKTAFATDTIKSETSDEDVEDFVEKNTLNIYNKNDGFAIERNQLLRRYFKKTNRIISVEFFGDFSIETGDVVSVELNELEADGVSYKTTKGVVTEAEMTYNGATSQKIIIHELQEA